MREKALQWHPAFQAALQVELLDDKEFLQYEAEYNLSKKPLQMDTLIIKLMEEHSVKKSIGRIFRKHNIVEYKSPDDYISVNDFYRVMGYACIYQSDTRLVLEIPPEEMTVTFICSHYPRRLTEYLEKRYGVVVRKMDEGIYYIDGLMFSVQLLITVQLSKSEYIWLSRLNRGLKMEEDIEPLARAYKGKTKDPLYQAVMELIVEANREKYEEGRIVCEALRALFADELIERETMGKEQGALVKLISQVRRKQQKGLSVEEIAEALEEKTEWIQKLYQAILDSPESTDEEICRRLN